MKYFNTENIVLNFGRIVNSALLFSFLFSIACTDNIPAKLSAVIYRPIEQDSCADNLDNTFHILLPQKLDLSVKLPLIIALDPNGEGGLAVSKFLMAVKYFPSIVIGSDLIKNNFSGYENSINELIRDSEKKYPVDKNQIIVAGFSGGARMALNYALLHQVKGVLMCGAGPDKQRPDCQVYALSGTADFNFSEQYRHPDLSSFQDLNYTADYFIGTHEWPPSLQISDGILFLLASGNPELETLLNERSQQLFALSDSLQKTENQFLAWKSLEKSAKFLVDKKQKRKSLSIAEKLLKEPDFIRSIQVLEGDLKTESSLMNAYSQRSMTENSNWWKNEISVLNQNISQTTAGTKHDHYQRIKGFIGIMLYSRINQLIYKQVDNQQLPVLLRIYELAEPDNSYVYYFQALHFFQLGDNQSCVESLGKSVKLGFVDFEKMKKDFPEEILTRVESIQK